MIRGVISTISSVRLRERLVVPNSRPSTGMRLSPGMPVSVVPSFCWMRPPNSTVWPLCTATWVASLRSEMVALPLTSATSLGWLTSWLMFM